MNSMKTSLACLMLIPLSAFAQTVPPAPSGSDPVHNSPWTQQDWVWFTQPGSSTSGDGDVSQGTIGQAELAAALVPADPAVRYASFAPRIGTVLTTDDPKTWNWDRSDRAQMQDVYYQLLEPSWEQLPQVTNWPTTYDAATHMIATTWKTQAGDFGTTDASWRNAVYEHINFARYLNFGASHVRYVKEDSNVLPWVQAATYWMGANQTITHTPDPISPWYSDLSFQGCFQSLLDLDWQTVNVSVWTYLIDPGNIVPGHRQSVLNDAATRVAVGSGRNPEGTNPSWGFNALWVRWPRAGAAPVQERDPLKAATVYPFPGYIPCPLLADTSVNIPAFDVMFSIAFNGPNTEMDNTAASEVTVTVTRNGVPLPIKNPGWGGNTFYYTVNLAWDDTQTPGLAGYYAQLDPSGFGDDQTFVVTYHNIRFTGHATPLYAGDQTWIDPVAFQSRDYSYTFTLFNPTTIKQAYPNQVSKIVGISGRSTIGTGDKIEVAGFQITGAEPMRVAIRAQGPGLTTQGITNPAASTQIKLYQITAAGTNPLLGTNTAWKQGSNWRLLESDHLSPSQDNEAALVATLPPGLYTAEVSDPTGKGGVGIAEIYAIDTVSQSQLTGISNRAVVGTAETALVAGFIITSPMTVMVRTQGPSLAKHGVTGPVQATKLTLVRISDQATLATNAGWQTSAYENRRFASDLSSTAPASTSEAAVILRLEPGTYTASVEAADGNPGVGIVEVYQVPDAID